LEMFLAMLTNNVQTFISKIQQQIPHGWNISKIQ